MFETRDAHVEELIKFRILNPDDLKINRAHHLADRQKRILYVGLASWLSLAVLEICVLIAMFIAGNSVIICLGMALFPFLIYLCLKEAEPFWKDINDDEPRSVTGGLYKDFRVTGGGKTPRVGHCSIRVGGNVFSISPSTYDHLDHQGFYRIYYVTHTRKVINIESL